MPEDMCILGQLSIRPGTRVGVQTGDFRKLIEEEEPQIKKHPDWPLLAWLASYCTVVFITVDEDMTDDGPVWYLGFEFEDPKHPETVAKWNEDDGFCEEWEALVDLLCRRVHELETSHGKVRPI